MVVSQGLGTLLELRIVVATPLYMQKVIAPVLEQPRRLSKPCPSSE
jgi:hypothetical protein